MLNTKNKVYHIKDVPSYWVFQYYINLDQTLSGQNVKIKSIWNTTDSVPSMCIYVDTSRQEYMFKDFSTGKFGDKINFVIEYFDIDYGAAVDKILRDYNEYIKTNGKIKLGFKPTVPWRVDYTATRGWNNLDAKYWLQYKIGSSILNKYNVVPIEYYNLVKDSGKNKKQISVSNNYTYGYYTKDNQLYKIYQPKRKRNKFLKVTNYIQGFDQLEFDKSTLVICSSLKDVMSLMSFNYNIEAIAPDSENTIIKPYIIESLKKRYKDIITMLDNDEPGKKAMAKYKDLFDINGFAIDLSKDFSDSVKDHGKKKVHKHFKILFKQCIK